MGCICSHNALLFTINLILEQKMPKTFKEVKLDDLNSIIAMPNTAEKDGKLTLFIARELELIRGRPETGNKRLEAARRAKMALNMELAIPPLDDMQMPASTSFRRG